MVPEFNIDHALWGTSLPDVLQLFEGEGAPIKKNLYKAYAEDDEDTLANTFFLLASNRLPDWHDSDKYPGLYKDQWKPLMTRIELVMLEESFENSEEFPYTAPTLAKALMDKLEAEGLAS